jgi:hypothetical protein
VTKGILEAGQTAVRARLVRRLTEATVEQWLNGGDARAELSEVATRGFPGFATMSDRTLLQVAEDADVLIGKAEVAAWAAALGAGPRGGPRIYITAHATHGDADSPGWAVFNDAERLCATLQRLQRVQAMHGLSDARVWMEADAWGADDDVRVTLQELVVLERGRFFVTGVPRDASYNVETELLDVDAFVEAVKQGSGPRLFFSEDGDAESLRAEVAESEIESGRARMEQIEASLNAAGYRMEADGGSIPGEGHHLVRQSDGELVDGLDASVPEEVLVLAREWSTCLEEVEAFLGEPTEPRVGGPSV